MYRHVAFTKEGVPVTCHLCLLCSGRSPALMQIRTINNRKLNKNPTMICVRVGRYDGRTCCLIIWSVCHGRKRCRARNKSSKATYLTSMADKGSVLSTVWKQYSN